MDAKIIAILIICIAAVLTAGCTGGSAPAGAATPAPTASSPDMTTAPLDSFSCTTDGDCMTAQCCHPTSCTGKTVAPSCNNLMCTMSCEGPLDCGAGSCGCVNGKCSVVAVQTTARQTGQKLSVRLEVSPQRYSPMMSSTPGIGLTPNITGFKAADATFEWNATDITWNPIIFEWNATYGTFLTWDAPDYTIHHFGNPVANSGGKVYWTFIDKPASVKDPVVITVTARDMTRRGEVPGTSTVTLGWDGDYAVYVQDIR